MSRPTLSLCLSLVMLFGVLEHPVTAKNPVDASRIKELEQWLPREPHGAGRPIDDRKAWEIIANEPGAKKVIQQAEKLLDTPIPELTDALFLEFSENGNRTRCQGVMFGRQRRISTLVLAECLENRGRFLPAIEESIRTVCAQRTWVIPAHDRGLTNFKGTEITIDLFSSATGWELATAADWLGEKLSPEARLLIADKLQERIFKPYESAIRTGSPRLWWLTTNNNWNAVCLANVTGAAMAAVDSPTRRAFYVAAAETYVQHFLSGFTSDGYCSEGMGYWNYGFGHYVMLAETLLQQTGGRLDLMDDDKIKQIARFARRLEILPGIYPAFADCHPDAQPADWLMAYLNRRYAFGWPQRQDPLVEVASSRYLLPFGLLGFPNSLTERPPVTGPVAKQPPREWFADAGVLICRPNADRERALGAAMKGGHNAEHHNHNDVGSYLVALGDETPLVDPGSEVYTRRTFSRQRYTSGVLNSFGHPVPRLDGQLQVAGRKAAAKVLETRFTDEQDVLVLDLSAAYRVAGLKKLRRTFTFSRRGRGSLQVTDHVAFDRPRQFGTALITFSPWERETADTLRIGEGADAVRVKISTSGPAVEVHDAEIREDLPKGRVPIRLGLDLADPVTEATITLNIEPAE